jgi:hypothetical protein
MKRGLRDVKGVVDVTRKPRQEDIDNLHEEVRQYYKGHLLNVIDRLTTLAEKAAAAPDTDEQHKQLPGVAERLRRSAEVALAQMNQSGVNDFCKALLAAVHITSLVPMDPALPRELLRQFNNQRMQRVKAARHPGSAEKDAAIAKMYKQGESLRDIGEEVDLSPDAVDERLRKMKIPRRRKKPKK